MWTCQCYTKQFENGSKLVSKPALHWPCERGVYICNSNHLMESTVVQWITCRWESIITCSVVPTNYKVARGGWRGIPNRWQVATATGLESFKGSCYTAEWEERMRVAWTNAHNTTHIWYESPYHYLRSILVITISLPNAQTMPKGIWSGFFHHGHRAPTDLIVVHLVPPLGASWVYSLPIHVSELHYR